LTVSIVSVDIHCTMPTSDAEINDSEYCKRNRTV
jgi:hypothetical protein